MVYPLSWRDLLLTLGSEVSAHVSGLAQDYFALTEPEKIVLLTFGD